MIILDTDVISETMKLRPDSLVITWLDRQDVQTIYLTAISLAELSFGIESLSEGKRKEALSDGLEQLVSEFFDSRVLAFDRGSALTYGLLLGQARAVGKSVSMADGQIAAIAKQHGFGVATRDVNPFVDLGVATINPWAD
jgi:toxin FitB